ncbi:MAG: ferredoxin [Calditrichaceae bacterium]|jgi:ferredoxin
MNLYVEENLCETYGFCVKEYPDLFRFTEGSKKAKVIDKNDNELTEEQLAEIADVCPLSAIKIKK